MSDSRLTIFLRRRCLRRWPRRASSGRRAPSFSLPDSHHAQHDILDYRGKLAAARFHEDRLPALQAAFVKALEPLQEKYGAKVAVLSIVITPPETQVTVAKYIAETKITSPILFDRARWRSPISRPRRSNPRVRHAASVRHQSRRE